MKKAVFLFGIIALLSTMVTLFTVQAQEAGNDPYVILVEYTFDEKDVDTVIDLLSEVQAQTLEKEEGCMVYDLLLSEDDPNTLFIYESYENEASYKAHIASLFKQFLLLFWFSLQQRTKV